MREDKPTQSNFLPSPDAMDITDEKFKELADLTLKCIEAMVFDGKSKSLMPMLVVHHRKFVEGNMLSDMEQTLVSISSDFNDGEVKRQTIRAIGNKFFEDKLFPVAVFMASEAWMSTLPEGTKEEDIDKQPMPRDDPNRKEVVMIAGRTTAGECTVGITIPFKRDANEFMVKDGEVITTDALEMYLLNNFFRGFFEKIVSKYTMEELEDMVAKYKGGRA